MPAPRARGGQRQVHPFGVQTGAQRGLRELLFLGFEGLFELLLGGIQQLADARPLLRRELAHLLAELREPALPAERVHPHRLQFFRRLRGFDAREGTGLQFLYGLIEHVLETLL